MNKLIPFFYKLFLSLTVLLFCISALVIYRADKVIKNQITKFIQSSVNNNPKSIYKVELGEIDIKIFQGNVNLTNIKLSPKVIDSTIKSKHIYAIVQIKSLIVQNLNWYNIIFKNTELATKKIEIINPQIDLFINKNGIKNKTTKDFDFENLILKNNIDLTFEEISVKNVNLSVLNSTRENVKIFSIEDFSINVKELSITPETIKKTNFPFLISDLTAGSGKISYHLRNDYKLEIGDFHYNLKKDKLRLNKLQYTNILTLKGYKKHFTDDSPYYKISVHEINLPVKRIDFDRFYYQIPIVKIDSLNVLVFQSKKREIRSPKIKPTLNESLGNIGAPILINQIQLSNCDFVYQFSESNTIDRVATVSFNKANVTIDNFTTIDTLAKKNPFLEISAQCKFMNKANLTLEAKYNLSSKKEEHQINAELSNFKLSHLNNTIAALAPVKIKKGMAHSAKIKYNANKKEAKGTIDLHYTDLWIEVIKNEEKHKQYGIVSLVVNNILKKNNIPDTPNYKQGKIDCKSDPNKSILNYMWGCVKSGLKSSISRSKKK